VLFPTAVIGYLSSLPNGIITKGLEILATQHLALQQAPLPVTLPKSLIDRYVARGLYKLIFNIGKIEVTYVALS
jgi:hypothetical protein